jgi:hypothetical protein
VNFDDGEEHQFQIELGTKMSVIPYLRISPPPYLTGLRNSLEHGISILPRGLTQCVITPMPGTVNQLISIIYAEEIPTEFRTKDVQLFSKHYLIIHTIKGEFEMEIFLKPHYATFQETLEEI